MIVKFSIILLRKYDRYVVVVNGVSYQIRPEDSNGWRLVDMAIAV
ncbi:MAG: hypothetical protein QNJ63_31835 [Calothrix sp. MO_192.B10]|nr:hypothetical protein [Calothrix sp. MO_192.B10]